ncbi:MAG: helix-turn-helix transcriptional regulator [Aquaticitalea sp.]
MQKLEVNSLPVNEVLSDLSKILDLPYETNCREHKLILTGEVGEGYIKAMMLESGLGIIEYNCMFNIDIELHFVKDSVHPLKFLYCTEGHFNHRFADTEGVHNLEQFQQAIVASKGNNGHIISFKKDVHLNLYSLEMDRQEFMIWDECSAVLVEHELNAIFGDVEAENVFYHEGYYSLELADVFNEIKHFDDNYFLKTIFMISSGYELLGKQILQYQDDLHNPEDRHLLRQNEVSSVHAAVKFINETIERSSTIETIANKVGLSEAKLQHGFKYLYNNTINGYINDVRLNLAADMLRSSDLNISEIVYKIGLTSRSYFSKVFKETYSCTPTEYREKSKTH